MKIYFAGSIRGGRDDKELYSDIVQVLKEYGKVLTEHIGDENLSSLGEKDKKDQYIWKRDLDWIDEADVVVAEVTNPSLGVGYEIGKIDQEKPVLCLYRNKNKSLSAMISGNKNVEVVEYESVEDVDGILEKFFKERT